MGLTKAQRHNRMMDGIFSRAKELAKKHPNPNVMSEKDMITHHPEFAKKHYINSPYQSRIKTRHAKAKARALSKKAN